MRILHTSDWHLGASLHGKKRYDESRKFLSWLLDTIVTRKIDLLLVSGDIFDSSAPGSTAQRMYYEFLGIIATSGCSSVIIVGGNHDSPSLLSAPKEILRSLNIFVIGSIPDEISDQVLSITGDDGFCRLIVCAVPFLREKDIRFALPAGSEDSQISLITRGITGYYSRVADIAIKRRDSIDPAIPIIATGHLFAAGCETRTGDGIRECYVGNSVLIGADAFSPCFSYIALGHLHVPQHVAGKAHIRYSGSPVPVGFSETNHEKMVIIIDTADPDSMLIEECVVPRFQRLASLKGDKAAIEAQIFHLIQEGEQTWVEVIVESSESSYSLQNWIQDMTQNTCIESLKTINPVSVASCLHQQFGGESLEHISERDVFERRLAEEDFSEEEKAELIRAFDEILLAYHEKDRMGDD